MELSTASQAQLDLFNVIERACSVFSLVGCIFIIVTFCTSDSFHKPINRLVFYASLYVHFPSRSLRWDVTIIMPPRCSYLCLLVLLRSGNMMTNVATLMARTYVDAPWSAGCQFQGFLIQM